MVEDLEIDLEESTLKKIIAVKENMGYKSTEWDSWFNYILNSISLKQIKKTSLEEVMEKKYNEVQFDDWVKNFALNLEHIWQEPSAKVLDLSNECSSSEKLTAIVIGRGPSLKQHKHLEQLADSNYDGVIVCTDGALVSALEAGVTPRKFSKYYVVTIDTIPIIRERYEDKIVKEYGEKIKGIFSSLTHPGTVDCARKNGIKIHWIHSLYDIHEGKKSFNNIAALMVRAKYHKNGLPAIQTGGNVGTASWFVSWRILKCKVTALIGIDHSWNENDPWEKIVTHGFTCKSFQKEKNNSVFKKLFPKKYNPEFQCNFILDPIFQYYSEAFKEFIKNTSQYITTINATEGGAIFGDGINCVRFTNFLKSIENKSAQ